MMEIEEIRKSLRETIDTADEKLLRLLHNIVLAHTNTYELTQWQKDELNRRSEADEEGLSWEEVKQRIRSGHQARINRDHSEND